MSSIKINPFTGQFDLVGTSGGGGGGVTTLNGLSGALSIVAGTNITVTPAGSNITIASTGSVSSVGFADSTNTFNVTGSPVTSSGTLTLSTFKSQAQNAVLAAPNGSSGSPSFRLLVSSDIPDLSATYVTQSEVGATNGVASLDSGGKVPVTQLPSTVMIYKGAWDASTNTPILADGTGVNGWVYRASVAGTQNLGSGPQTWAVGDFAIYNGTIWQHSPAADGVSSVNGSTGAVTVNAINQLTGDVTAGPVSGSTSAAATLTATSNSTLVTLSALSLPYSQITGTPTPGANTALSNLSAVAINTALLPNTNATTFANGLNIGSTSFTWGTVYANGIASTGGSNTLINTVTGAVSDTAGNESINWVTRGLYDTSANLQASWTSSGLALKTALLLDGSTSGAFTQQAAATTTPYTVTWPAAQASGTQVLQNNGSGVLSWASSSGGSVTSVAFADASTTPIYSISGSPVTSSGTLTQTLTTQAANIIFAGPSSGSAAQPTFRALVSADIPSAIVTAGSLATVTDGITTNQSGAGSTIQSLRPISYAYTLTSTDITNQYVDLDVANGFPSNDPAYGTSALINSVMLSPDGGPLQQKGVDFTVSLTGGSSGSTRVSFAGDIATGGSAALVAADVVTFSYSYL